MLGNEYTITGTLMDQKTGKAVLDDDGNEITASKVITATESNGTVEIAVSVCRCKPCRKDHCSF